VTGVVVDTNVYISALAFGGVPQRALELISSNGLPLYISPSIMDEVSGTLAAKFDWTKAELELFLPPLWDRCIIIKPTLRLEICSDPDDNHVLECAVAAEAEFLITGNAKHFPKAYKATKVINPRQLLDILAPGAEKS
jgi:putative PIN family toxin of toxin-antitoxin system